MSEQNAFVPVDVGGTTVLVEAIVIPPENGSQTAQSAQPEKAGRGKTRDTIKLADLVDDVAGSELSGRFIDAMNCGTTAKELKSKVKADLAAAKKAFADAEHECALRAALAEYVERAESLSPTLRIVAVKALIELTQPMPAVQA